MKGARNFGLIALGALLLWAAPGHSGAMNAVVTAIFTAFFVAIAFLGNRLYREHRMTLESLPELDRVVLYCCIGLAFLTWAAWPRFTGLSVLVGVALLGIASLGVFWVITRYRRYD